MLLYTGRRPSEITGLKTSQLKGDVILLKEHKNRKRTQQSEVIYFNSKALCLVSSDSEWLVGREWNEPEWQTAFRDLPFDCVAYDLRHTFITNSLMKGIPLAVLAEMVGNSPQVLLKYYSKVGQVSSGIREYAEQAVGFE